MDRTPEILAPAGSMDALRAAVECGADAVYLGAGHFNARRNARNFSEEDLAQAIEYCHVRGVSVHLTLNTLVTDDELPAAIDLMETACRLGADALIVQDLGIAALARACAPDMELHASTQMAVMTPEGFRELAALGFRRAVLPRELSYDEILAIRKATADTGLELEMFIHGALCMCVSGQCYLSATMGGRSGNRGLCAQPCRLRFAAEGGRRSDHALSLKDLSAVEAIPELFEAGVTSFKIEGRMKRPEYVAAAVTACRNAADGIEDPAMLENLDAVFSRSGHTDGYLKGRLGHDMFGTRQKDDVLAAGPILKELEQLYARPTRAVPVAFSFTAETGKPLTLTATRPDPHGGPALSVTADTGGSYEAQPACSAGATVEKVAAQLGKTGGTGYSVREEDMVLRLDESLYLPASVLNQLRRDALDALTEAVVEQYRVPFDRGAADALLNETAKENDSTGTVVRIASSGQLPADIYRREMKSIAWLLPLDTPPSVLKELRSGNERFGVDLPRGLYQSKDRVLEQLHTAKQSGAQFAYAGTLDGIALAKAAGLPVLGGFPLNLFNSVARREYEALGVEQAVLSQELKLTQAADISGCNGLLVYGRSPLMLTRNCPDGIAPDAFRDPARPPELTDRKGIRFPVVKSGDAYELLNSRPLYLADRQDDLPEHCFRLLWFTIESEAEVRDVLNAYRTGRPAEGDFTRGLYYKGVL